MNPSLDASPKTAQLWHKLHLLQREINNELLPLIAYLEIDKEDAELGETLEACAQAIGKHLRCYQIQVVKLSSKI